MEQADKSVVPEVSLSRQLDMADAATSVKNPAATPVDAAAYARGLGDAAKICDEEAEYRRRRHAMPLPGDDDPTIQAHKQVTAHKLGQAIRAKIKQATGGKS